MQEIEKTLPRPSIYSAGVCLALFLATSLIPMKDARAQVPPTSICPVASNASFRVAPPSPPGPINEGAVTQIAIRVRANEVWDFIPENIQVSGFSVTMGANSERIIIPDMFPLQYRPIGQLPAGSYTVTINPVVTSATPNVACPALTVPLLVAQTFVNVPVPLTKGAWTALLAGLAGVLGLGWMSRQRFSR